MNPQNPSQESPKRSMAFMYFNVEDEYTEYPSEIEIMNMVKRKENQGTEPLSTRFKKGLCAFCKKLGAFCRKVIQTIFPKKTEIKKSL